MNQDLNDALANAEVLILGAGPGGLTAAYQLLKQGVKVVLVEKDRETGGLMRAVKHGDFTVDFGYKHLYNRIPEVHALWSELLGKDFLQYQPRTGILYKGRILERERSFKGLRRGMPYRLLVSALIDWAKYSIRYRNRTIQSLEDYTYARRGAKFTRIFSQEFEERFKGVLWSDLPAPPVMDKKGPWKRLMSDATKNLQKQAQWFHPAKGTGQIVDRLTEEVLRLGGSILLNTKVKQTFCAANLITEVTLEQAERTLVCQPKTVVSSLTVELVAPLMGIAFEAAPQELSFQRGVVMVYLFLDHPSSFPHTSLHVTCPDTSMARITNFGALGGEMVPPGKGCLCIEYFTSAANNLMPKTDADVLQFVLQECEKANLLRREHCVDSLIFKLAKADPAASWEDYRNDPSRKALYDQLAAFTNFYQINRTGTDKSTFAGLMAAKAIVAGDKSLFEKTTRPDVNAPWEG
jgi:protoporphyrinogen oxidase